MDFGSEQNVLLSRFPSMTSIVLNRPEAINSLTEGMIDRIGDALSEATSDENCGFVLFYARTGKGFCAGGDVKTLARLGKEKEFDKVDRFFQKEYDLDLKIHIFPKPVIVIADGITMGGGLGITAGASIRIATERTRMAMPETKIGFFPDVGATGWMFSRCPKGYPEYLGLTGYEMVGKECMRLGFASHFMNSKHISQLINLLENYESAGRFPKEMMNQNILEKISRFFDNHIEAKPGLDRWVEKYFSGQTDLSEVLRSLSLCHEQEESCHEVFTHIAERSPTALVLTLKLLRHNEGRPLAEVFTNEQKASAFISRHPDYLEGVRARLIDRDDQPQWQPERIDQVDLSSFVL
jgi:enoyl-CoA hydratase